MKIYTKTGDDGSTSLHGGSRVYKNSARVSVYGAVDELNSIIGIITTLDLPSELKEMLIAINNMLFTLGSDLATPYEPEPKFKVLRIKLEYIEWLERKIDMLTEPLPPLRNFVLPGGTAAAAYLHNARTVCRRAEREAVGLAKNEYIGEGAVKFLNRLSDFLFTAARFANYSAGIEDEKWQQENIELK